MVNLLSKTQSKEPFQSLDPDQCERFGDRLETLLSVFGTARRGRFVEEFSGAIDQALEELENEASLVTAMELLDRIERFRLDRKRDEGGPGRAEERIRRTAELEGSDFVCYWPGRSLATGEAEVASRGFFDGIDRPPIGFWIEAVARPTGWTRARFEVVVVAWVPASEVERAEAGCAAAANQSLLMLRETSETIANQLFPILGRYRGP